MVEKLPNFFIIGAAKSGTTSLHEYLDQHPEIYMSFPKELNFFSFVDSTPNFVGPYGDTRNRALIDRLRREKYEFSVTTWPEYKKVFAHAGSAKAIGESSVSYLYFPEAAERLRQFAPRARLVAILRNPVDRAHSKYRQLRRDAAEPLAYFDEAVAAEPVRMLEGWSPAWFYVDRGFYYRQIKLYFERFDHSLIHVIIYDDFVKDTQTALQETFAFLQVDSKFRIDLDHRYNASDDKRTPRSMYLYDLAARPNLVSRTTRAMLPKKAVARIRPIVRKVLSKSVEEAEIATLTDQTRANLKDVFREDLLRLQDLIRRDLSSWL